MRFLYAWHVDDFDRAFAGSSQPDEDELRTLLTGNLCRCTGYQAIVEAGLEAARRMREQGGVK